jgi:methylated-DNA-[protein]-cysteine S-methyltransferase
MQTSIAAFARSNHPTRYQLCPTPIGTLTLHGDGERLHHLYFPGRAQTGAEPAPRHIALKLAADQLEQYFAGERRHFELPLAAAGTSFQRRVWQLLQEIPYGETTTYGEIARLLTVERGGERVEPRAVAGAVARTPVPIIIPCHRVIGADGSLRGYLGGLDRKRKLLDFECGGGDPRALEPQWRDQQLTLI